MIQRSCILFLCICLLRLFYNSSSSFSSMLLIVEETRSFVLQNFPRSVFGWLLNWMLLISDFLKEGKQWLKKKILVQTTSSWSTLLVPEHVVFIMEAFFTVIIRLVMTLESWFGFTLPCMSKVLILELGIGNKSNLKVSMNWHDGHCNNFSIWSGLILSHNSVPLHLILTWLALSLVIQLLQQKWKLVFN